ncbi:MAG: hypothetical protein ACE3JQ_04045 [Paenisporosarcina sp.]
MEDNYLSSLIGRVVQIYRGGPDSNNGWLMDVNEDYLTLQKDNGEIIYYKTAHIKSIRENTMIKYNSLLSIGASNTIFKAPTFNELASHLKEQTVRINGRGPESKKGQLIDVKEDYLTLYSEDDGLVFFNEQHIKSISSPTAEEEEKVENQTDSTNTFESLNEETNTGLTQLLEEYGHVFDNNMNGVLTNLKYSWIKINRKGPESLEGMLVDSNDNHLVIVVANEILRVSTYHVKNFSVKNMNSKEVSSEKDVIQQEEEEKTTKPVEHGFTKQQINSIIRKRKRRAKNKAQLEKK